VDVRASTLVGHNSELTEDQIQHSNHMSPKKSIP
jgi:hypothetical protein